MGIRPPCVGPTGQVGNAKDWLNTYRIKKDEVCPAAKRLLVIPREKHNRRISQFVCQMEERVCAPDAKRRKIIGIVSGNVT